MASASLSTKIPWMPKMLFLVSTTKSSVVPRLTLPAFHGSEFKGERLTVQFARGPRRKDDFGPSDRNVPRPRRTIYRMNITGLVPETSWQVRNIIPSPIPTSSCRSEDLFSGTLRDLAWAAMAPHRIHLLTLGLGPERLRTQLWPAGCRLLGDRA